MSDASRLSVRWVRGRNRTPPRRRLLRSLVWNVLAHFSLILLLDLVSSCMYRTAQTGDVKIKWNVGFPFNYATWICSHAFTQLQMAPAKRSASFLLQERGLPAVLYILIMYVGNAPPEPTCGVLGKVGMLLWVSSRCRKTSAALRLFPWKTLPHFHKSTSGGGTVGVIQDKGVGSAQPRRRLTL